MAESAEWASDMVFPHIQPWYSVGIYATTFGCRYYWDGENAPQVRPIFRKAAEVADIRKPDLCESEPMQEVLDRIRWYREVTGDRLPICLTDTQSANDTVSLIMETNEFFTVSAYEHEKIERFMNAITDLIIEYSERQMEVIGPTTAALRSTSEELLCTPVEISPIIKLPVKDTTFEAG